MPHSLHQQFNQHGAWRRDLARQVRGFADWLGDNDLMDPLVADRIRQLEGQMRASRVMVAFVAEYSRGKSELINAMFFPAYGRRIMPASAGRTTMCPTELGYDPALPPRLWLLPIETRLDPRPLAHWQDEPARWVDVAIDIHDVEMLAAAMQKVSEVRQATVAEARALGFWNDEEGSDNPLPDAQGLVEIPHWRHAILNMPHPLLEQGLVILDTPGLNAIGAEPELTMSLIPQAHAVVFILGADTGVTRSDLAIWREHLMPECDGQAGTRIAVLNKIDTLWDILSTPAEVERQVMRQCAESARVLGIPVEQVLPVSAQKGLQAKIRHDQPLLLASRLPALETALGTDMLGKRETMLRLAVENGIAALRNEAERALRLRQESLAQQETELQGLRGKNAGMVQQLRVRIENEQAEFENSHPRILALRSVQGKLLREVYAILGKSALRADMAQLAELLKRPGIKLNVRKAYGQTFEVLRHNLTEVQVTAAEIQAMLGATFHQLNTEYGFTLQPPSAPDLEPFARQLGQIERSHLQYLGMNNMFRLAQQEFCDKLVHALTSRLRAVNEAAMVEIERWSKDARIQLDSQLRERRSNYGKRLESIERIQQAASSLDERLAEIDAQKARLVETGERLCEQTTALAHLMQFPQKAPQAPATGELRMA